jgi:hypothetical protein
MRSSHPEVKILGLLCLEGVLVSSLGGCADLPTSYWVKSGVTQEQISKDNLFCADSAHEKRENYIRRREMFIPVNQAAYKRCMTSRGYQMVPSLESRQGILPVTPQMSRSQMKQTRALCDRVVGEAGDVNSCVRWMSLNPNWNVLPLPSSELHDWPEQQSFRTSVVKGETKVCLHYDSHDTTKLQVITSKSCDSNGSESP